MLLQLATWPEVEGYLARRRAVIIPIGSTEQHGPTGLIGTDSITAETMARRTGERLETMVGPTIAVGMAHHHMAFPGSMTLRPSTLIALIRDYVLSLSAHGFRDFLFINGHGGNIATVNAAFYEIHETQRAARGESAPNLRCALCSWFTMPGVAALQDSLFGDGEGAHATPSEISVTQAVHPDRPWATAPLDPVQAPGGAFHDCRDFRARFPDGRIGSDPALARAEHGHRFIETAVAEIAAHYGAFLDGA